MRIAPVLTATALIALSTAPALAQASPDLTIRAASPFRRLDRADREALFDAQMAAIPIALRLSPDQRALWNPVEQSLRAMITARLDRQEERRRREEAALGAEGESRAEPRRAEPPAASPQTTPPAGAATAQNEAQPGPGARPAPQGQAAPPQPSPQATPPAGARAQGLGLQAAQTPPAQTPSAQAPAPQAQTPQGQAAQGQAQSGQQAQPGPAAPRQEAARSPQPTELWLEEIEERSRRLAQSAERVRAFSAAMRPFWASLDDRQRRLLGILMRWPRGMGPNNTSTMAPPRDGPDYREGMAGPDRLGRGDRRGGYEDEDEFSDRDFGDRYGNRRDRFSERRGGPLRERGYGFDPGAPDLYDEGQDRY